MPSIIKAPVSLEDDVSFEEYAEAVYNDLKASCESATAMLTAAEGLIEIGNELEEKTMNDRTPSIDDIYIANEKLNYLFAGIPELRGYERIFRIHVNVSTEAVDAFTTRGKIEDAKKGFLNGVGNFIKGVGNLLDKAAHRIAEFVSYCLKSSHLLSKKMAKLKNYIQNNPNEKVEPMTDKLKGTMLKDFNLFLQIFKGSLNIEKICQYLEKNDGSAYGNHIKDLEKVLTKEEIVDADIDKYIENIFKDANKIPVHKDIIENFQDNSKNRRNLVYITYIFRNKLRGFTVFGTENVSMGLTHSNISVPKSKVEYTEKNIELAHPGKTCKEYKKVVDLVDNGINNTQGYTKKVTNYNRACLSSIKKFKSTLSGNKDGNSEKLKYVKNAIDSLSKAGSVMIMSLSQQNFSNYKALCNLLSNTILGGGKDAAKRDPNSNDKKEEEVNNPNSDAVDGEAKNTNAPDDNKTDQEQVQQVEEQGEKSMDAAQNEDSKKAEQAVAEGDPEAVAMQHASKQS